MSYFVPHLKAGMETQQEHPRWGWIMAKPYPGPLSWRIRDAWLVLTGRAEALVWPEEEDDD